MAQPITPAQLDDLFQGATPFALVDVREAGEYNASHIPGSSLMPRRMLEFDLPRSGSPPGIFNGAVRRRWPARGPGSGDRRGHGLYQRGLAGRRR